MFGDFRLEPRLDAEASRVAHYSIPAARPRLTFSAAARGVTDPGAHCSDSPDRPSLSRPRFLWIYREVDVVKIGEHAVVLGASMSGLLAARVLSDFYRTVTVVERDVLPTGNAQRRGVPQGQHAHALWPRGAQTLDRFFPGLLTELIADGCTVWDDGDLSRVCVSFGGTKLSDLAAFLIFNPATPVTTRVVHSWRPIAVGGYAQFPTWR